MPSQHQKSPQESEYVKVPNIAGLYRHSASGRYYGCKKVDGRRKERSLGTTDRKIAERRLKEWIANLGKVDKEVEKMTLKQLHQRLIAISQGKSDSTLCIVKGITREFEKWWPYGPNPEVRNIRPSHLEDHAVQGGGAFDAYAHRYAEGDAGLQKRIVGTIARLC